MIRDGVACWSGLSRKPLLATREDTWLYRGQRSLVVDGHNDDPRELVDIAEVAATASRDRGHSLLPK